MTISVKFTDKKGGAPNILAEAAILFHGDCGPFAGFELVGITVWRGRDGKEDSVTFPARTWDKDGKKQYFDYIRLQKESGIPDTQKWALKNYVIAEYKKFARGDSF